jgi:hypothetical protein
MNRLCRWLALAIAAAWVAPSVGCAIGRKPYTKDPLVRANRVTWGGRSTTAPVNPEPVAPPAPNAPLIGSELLVTSRP